MIRSSHDRDDAVAEVVARAWELFVDAPASPVDQFVLPVITEVQNQLTREATAAH